MIDGFSGTDDRFLSSVLSGGDHENDSLFNNRRQDTILPHKMAVTSDEIKLSESICGSRAVPLILDFIAHGGDFFDHAT